MQQVVKYPIIGINQDDDDVNLKPGWCREIWNALPKNGFSKSAVQNIKGTVIRTNGSLPAGTNTCIGAFADRANNRIFYFIHNSNDDHGLWYFKPNDNTHQLVMQTEFFNFDTAFPITSCDFIEDIIQFGDNNSEDRSLIVARAVAGDLYDFATEEAFNLQCSLFKPIPRFPPVITEPRSTGTSGFNNITNDSFQFCCQFLYYDNTVSEISPLSKLSPGDIYPLSTNTRNKITVTLTVDSRLVNVVKKIYFIYVKNDDGNFQLFREVDVTAPTTTYAIDFYGTDTIQTIFPSQVSFIPKRSKNIIIHNQRTIVTMDEFDYEESDVTLTLATVDVGTIVSTRATKICAPNSSYTIGFLYFDRFGRTPGITASATVVTGNILQAIKLPSDDQDIISSTDNLRISWSAAGTVPSWAKTCAVTMKPNNTLQTAYACLIFPMFYRGEGTADSADFFADNGIVFYEDAQNSWSKQIYWKVPSNLPFSLDGSFKIRLLNSIGQTKQIEDIIAIRGDKVVTENFGITNWLTLLGTTKGMINVIFEKYKDDQDEVFSEVSQHFDCSSGSLASVNGIITGDYFYMESKLQFQPLDSGDVKYGGIFGDAIDSRTAYTGKPITVPVISQSPTHATVTIEDVKQTVDKQSRKKKAKKFLGILQTVSGALSFVPGLNIIGAGITAGASVANAAIGDASDRVTETISIKNSFTPDYNKIANDSGRIWIDVKDKKISYQPNTLSISDPYIVNSKISGLSNFRTLYDIPISRTQIRKMVNVGASNILLAIHERTTTSLATYSNSNILNTTDGSQLLGEGDKIIGYHNELAGGYGTIYPDSIVTDKGRTWFFDPFSGEVVRYANNGLTPIGSIYKMHTFFRQKGDQFIDPTGRNVVAGYDSNLEILYITFRSSDPSEEITVAFVDRQGEERWIMFSDLILPERYAFINDRLFGFMDGEMWELNMNSTYNLFFGEQGTTRIKHLFNTEISREKRLVNISVESNKKWDFDPITVAKFGVDQETSLAKSNFIRRDDVFYADVKRDKNTAAGLLPAGKSALVAGQPMIGKVYEINLENDDTVLVELDFLNYGFFPQSGHNIV